MSARRDDIAMIERSLRLVPGRHAPTCEGIVRHEGGRTLIPIWPSCDCGRDALDRLTADVYERSEVT